MSLDQLDGRIAELRTSGKHLEALNLVEEGIEVRKKVFGLNSEEVTTSYLQLCDLCNIVAAEYLQREDFHLALDLLKRAELLCKEDVNYKVKTFNNLACYYRQAGKTRIAQSYLYKALSLQGGLASTHLNLCAVLSQLDKHEQALIHSMQAVIILQDSLISGPKEQHEDLPPMLAIAYHNMGVELEFLKRVPEAISIYKKAEEFARENLTPDHPITANATKALLAASKSAKVVKGKTGQRKQKQPKGTLKHPSKVKLSTGYLSDEDIEIINKAWRSANEKKTIEGEELKVNN